MVRFVITGQARTGSTMLGSALGSHPQVLMHGELFGDALAPLNFYGLDENLSWPTPIELCLKRVRDQDVGRFLEEFVFSPTARTAIGFKFKFEEFALWPQTLEYLERQDIRFIMMKRRNLWHRFRSTLDVSVVGSYNSSDSITSVGRRNKLDVTPILIEKAFEVSEIQEENFRSRFSNHPILHVAYEDMLSDFATQTARVCEFLEVRNVEISPFSKKRPTARKIEDLIDMAEIRRHFQATKYAFYFDEQ